MNAALRFLKEFFIPRHSKGSLIVLSLALLLAALLDDSFWRFSSLLVDFYTEVHIVAILLFGVLFPAIVLCGLMQSLLYLFNRSLFFGALRNGSPSFERASIEIFALVAFVAVGVESIIGVLVQGGSTPWLVWFTWYSVFYLVIQMVLTDLEFMSFTKKLDCRQVVGMGQRIGIIGVLAVVYGYVYVVSPTSPTSWATAVAVSLILWNMLEGSLRVKVLTMVGR